MNETIDQLPEVVVPTSDERTWAMFGHLSAFSAFLTGIGMVIGPLIVWLVKRDTMPFVADQAKEALNFNITVLLVGVALMLLVILTFGIGLLIVWPVGAVVFVAWVVLTIIATVNANNGTYYRYPFTLRLIK